MQIIPRSQIGLQPPRNSRRMTTSRRVVLHYFGPAVYQAVYDGDYDAVARALRAIQRSHMESDRLAVGGAADIGYNHAIDTLGRVYELRGWGVVGAHAPGANGDSHGVLLILGGDQKPTALQLRSLLDLVEEHERRYGSRDLAPHSRYRSTSCPGPHLTSLTSVSAVLNLLTDTATPDLPDEVAEVPAGPRDYVTYGDVGSRVLAWQKLLVELLPKHDAVHRPDGDFGPKTLALTVAAYELLGLSAADRRRPRVGARSIAAAEAKIAARHARRPQAPTPTPPARPAAERLLSVQDPYLRGDDVRDIQQNLADRGYAVGRADGVFGPRTDAAVRRFQADRQITVDGVVGPQTRRELARAGRAGRAAPELSRLLRLASPYMRGEDVRQAQARLDLLGHGPGAADGVYGPQTRAAVRRFQAAAGVAVDGVVGPETWAVLMGVTS